MYAYGSSSKSHTSWPFFFSFLKTFATFKSGLRSHLKSHTQVDSTLPHHNLMTEMIQSCKRHTYKQHFRSELSSGAISHHFTCHNYRPNRSPISKRSCMTTVNRLNGFYQDFFLDNIFHITISRLLCYAHNCCGCSRMCLDLTCSRILIASASPFTFNSIVQFKLILQNIR